jgi:hypothetical protein
MDPDLALIIGGILAVISVPSMVSAISDRRAPRVSAITLVLGGLLMLYAFTVTAVPYTFGSIPSVLGRVLRVYLL